MSVKDQVCGMPIDLGKPYFTKEFLARHRVWTGYSKIWLVRLYNAKTCDEVWERV